ncbi:hypothetical protein TYRP_012411 [Tyrophagus putrescentiae]|nr:hypothetical protein TYRP_012411 [Tyrophagus putrescentiae]
MALQGPVAQFRILLRSLPPHDVCVCPPPPPSSKVNAPRGSSGSEVNTVQGLFEFGAIEVRPGQGRIGGLGKPFSSGGEHHHWPPSPLACLSHCPPSQSDSPHRAPVAEAGREVTDRQWPESKVERTKHPAIDSPLSSMRAARSARTYPRT